MSKLLGTPLRGLVYMLDCGPETKQICEVMADETCITYYKYRGWVIGLVLFDASYDFSPYLAAVETDLASTPFEKVSFTYVRQNENQRSLEFVCTRRG
jgi:hypothetical protein